MRLSRIENDSTISFIPPDGEFELMSYRLNTQVSAKLINELHIRRNSLSYVIDNRKRTSIIYGNINAIHVCICHIDARR